MSRRRTRKSNESIQEAIHTTNGKAGKRRLARAAVGVVVLIALAGACAIFLTPEPQSSVLAVLDNCPDPLPEPGPGRAWEADVPIATYSSANTRTRNVLTTLPIFAWSGFGPDMDMVLIHNSGAVGGVADPVASAGFTLGDG